MLFLLVVYTLFNMKNIYGQSINQRNGRQLMLNLKKSVTSKIYFQLQIQIHQDHE